MFLRELCIRCALARNIHFHWIAFQIINVFFFRRLIAFYLLKTIYSRMCFIFRFSIFLCRLYGRISERVDGGLSVYSVQIHYETINNITIFLLWVCVWIIEIRRYWLRCANRQMTHARWFKWFAHSIGMNVDVVNAITVHFDCPQFVATQCVAFVIHVAGAATLLDYSTLNSSIQPIIRDSMKRLIMSSSLPESNAVLKMIQENVSRTGLRLYC